MRHGASVWAGAFVVAAAACNGSHLAPDFVTFGGIVTAGTRVAGVGRVTVEEIKTETRLETDLNEDGTFEIDIADDRVSLCASAWEYVDPATGSTMPWRYGHRWCTVKKEARSEPYVHVTPYTQLVYRYAEHIARTGGGEELYKAWGQSKQQHQAFFGCAMPGVDLTAIAPVDITADGAPQTLSAGVYLGATIAALSEMAKLANQQQGQADTTRVTLLDVIETYGQDGQDGVYDDVVGTRTVTLGNRLAYDGLRSGPAGFLTALRRVLESDSNQTGLRADDVRDWFQCIADYDGHLVRGKGVLDRDPPVITLEDPPDGTLVVSGTIPGVRALCSDVDTEVRRFELEEPEAVVRAVTDLDGTREGLTLGSFDSTVLRDDDGDAVLRLVCVDETGFETDIPVRISVDRTGPTVTSALADGAWIPGDVVVLSGTVSDPHGVEQMSVNGIRAPVDDETWRLEAHLDTTPADVRLEAIDSVGNPSLLTIRLHKDLEQPVVLLVTPTAGVVGQTFTLEATASDNVQVAGLRVLEPDYLAALPDADPDPTRLLLQDVDTSGFPVRFVARVRAVDHVGHERDLRLTLEVDRVPPVVSVLSHQSGQWVGQSQVALSGTTEGAARVEVNGVVAQGVDTWTAQVALAEGENAINVDAYDTVENLAEADVTLFADLTKPVVQSVNLADGVEGTLMGNVDLEICATDANGIHPSADSFVFSGVPDRAISDLRLAQQDDTDVVMLATLDTTVLEDGETTVEVVTVDKVGHRSDLRSLRVLVDNNPPTATLRVIPRSSGRIDIYWTASDAASELDWARLTRGNRELQYWPSLSGLTAEETASTRGLDCVGDDVYRLEVADAMGHVGSARWSRICESIGPGDGEEVMR